MQNLSLRKPLIFCVSLMIRFIGIIKIPGLSLRLLSGLTPVIGFFTNYQSCCALFICRTLINMIFTLSLAQCGTYLPSLAGSLVLCVENRFFKSVLPLICIATFIAHPIGAESWKYTLYWLIPALIGCMKNPSLFMRSLLSTFTTHAVGSTLYLYTHPTTGAFWHALIAQVWFERLCYATLLCVCYYAIHMIQYYISGFFVADSGGHRCSAQLSFS